MHLGIDEAGRGPVIGPLVVCGVAVSEDQLPDLESLNLRDSKRLTRRRREELEEAILSIAKCSLAEVPASEIDLRMHQKTLNDIEVELFSQVLLDFPQAKTIIVDACDVNAARFGERICFCTGVSRVISKHKADDIYPVVSAASIVAKVRRDRSIDELKEIYGDFGSGYCSDKKTQEFLTEYIKKEKRLPPIARSSWEPARRLLEESFQRSLDEF